MSSLETEVRDEYRQLTKRLISAGISISTMESATGGQICSLLTDTEGASGVVRGGLVTYINEAKLRFGISGKTLEEFSVYSNQISREMALKCRELFESDIGIGITGTTGNIDPANAEHSVPGRVFFSIASSEGTRDYAMQMEPQSSRLDYKLIIARHICNALCELLDHVNN